MEAGNCFAGKSWFDGQLVTLQVFSLSDPAGEGLRHIATPPSIYDEVRVSIS